MTSSVFELSKRLQRSLDSNYNVIDLVAVFEIIRILEGTRITTEQLETTRLAKYINQLRRKTTNEQLARQAKNLLKKWRDNLMPAIASGSSQPPTQATTSPVTTSAATVVTAPTAAAAALPLTNGLPPVVRSQPTTPSRPVLQQQNPNHPTNNNTNSHHQTSSSCEKANIPDSLVVVDHNNDSRSLGSSNLTGSRRGVGGGAGAGLTIPTELTNFYLKNKKILDGSDVRVVAPVKEEPVDNHHHHHHQHSFAVDEVDPGDVDARDKQKRKGRKREAKRLDTLIGSTGSLFSSNSNSGFPGDSSATTSTTTTVGKKVKTTRQLVADLKFRNEQNLRNASYPDLSNEHAEHHHHHHNNNNNNNGLSSSPMSASNDSQHHHLFHHHHHNQHLGGDQLVFHSAPVTPSGIAYAGVKREGSPGLLDEASVRRREKKRRKMEKGQVAATANKLKVKKREKTPPPASGLNFLNQVDEDIWQLRNKLPPIDRKAILRQMKAENVAQAERQCTCEMVECSQEEAEQAAGVIYASLDDILEPVVDNSADAAVAVADVLSSVTGGAADVTNLPSTSSTAAANSSAAAALPPTKVTVVRNKRSIFDDDDPPSPTAIDKNNNSEGEEREERFPFPSESHHQHHPPPPPVPVLITAPVLQPPPPPPHPMHIDAEDPSAGGEAEGEEEPRVFYKFVEGSNCPVKRRAADLVRLSADYHLAALHQLYVPGINGNWGSFPDLAILRVTQRQQLKELLRAKRAIKKKQQQQLVGSRKRKRSSSDEDDDDEDEDDEDENLFSNSTSVIGGTSSDNSELIECWERLQATDTDSVEAVVPLVNPFFYFLQSDEKRRLATEEAERVRNGTAGNLLANMAGLLPRFVPLRTDFGVVIVPPEVPPAQEATTAPATAPPLQFNRELARELDIEAVCEGLRGDVYEPRELEKFLEAVLVQRLPKFQMANLFYKRSWPGAEDRQDNLSLELLNSLYLNRVLEFRRRRRRRRKADNAGRMASLVTHRKRRRKSEEGDGEGEGESDVEVEVNDVHVFDGFLEMQTMAFRSDGDKAATMEGAADVGNGQVVVRSARRLFYVNDDRLFGHQPSILDELIDGGAGGDDPLPVLDDDTWDLFRVRWQALEFLPPVLSATARILHSSWPRMRWNFLLDYFKDRDQSALVEEADEDEGGEVVRIHENNFRLPSFNRLTEENLLGVRQRRGRGRVRGNGEEEEEEEAGSVLPGRVQCRVESFRERDFVRACMERWPQLFEGISFDYEKGVLGMRHADVDARWRFLGEFRELLKEVTRLGVAGEEDDEEEEEEFERTRGGRRMTTGQLKNGFSSVKTEGSDAEEEEEEVVVTAVSGALRPVDVPQVELFKEWHESVQVQSYNDELLTILPYVVID